jgi:hypothetical protein
MALSRQPAGVQHRWDDLRFPFTAVRLGATSKPDYDYVNNGLLFPQNDAAEIIYIIAQIPHHWLQGSNLSPHVHFIQAAALTPVFKMDYRWYENGGDPTGAFATLTASTFAFTYPGAGSILQIVSFPEIDGSAINSVSSILDIRVYREDNVAIGDVLAKEFDIHYQIDSRGSRQEYTK